jgi:hypothetical protein
MKECEYPPCPEPATQERGIVVFPPIGIRLCERHAAMIDRDTPAEDPDFWRWASAAMQEPGHG